MTTTETHDASPDQRARAFIDRIMEINREHGMGNDVSEDTYRRVVEESTKAYAGLEDRD